MIVSLQCQRFRALQETSWEPSGGAQLLLGGTGEGKTSLLEAIYLAATTRSFRTSRLGDCVPRLDLLQSPGETADPPSNESAQAAARSAPSADDGFFSAIEVANAARARLEVSWQPGSGLRRRLNSERSSLEEHLSQQPVLAFSAADVDVLVGAPELRRRLIDRVSVALQPSSLATLSQYRRALDHKRALLARHSTPDREALLSFNTLLAQSAELLIARRRDSVAQLAAALRDINAEFPRPNFDLDIRYLSSPAIDCEKADLGTGSQVLQALEGQLATELRNRRPMIGPHRDRIDILFRGRPVAETASAGERKAAALLLLAAQERLLSVANRPCVLLVDDVDTEMDQATLEALLPLLIRGPQTLFSSNREAVFERIDLDARWRVCEGTVRGE